MIGWVNRYKVERIRRLIDQQILLRTNQLVTFVLLQRAIDQRQVRGELRVEDIEYIKTELKKLGKQNDRDHVGPGEAQALSPRIQERQD